MPFSLGPGELILIALIVITVFGVGKVAEVGPALGRSIRDFRRAVREDEESNAKA
jgi:sec-independent protein translocase protein TatA